MTAEEVQFLIDLVRANAKVARPAIMEQLADSSFVERARRDLGLTRSRVLAAAENLKWQITDLGILIHAT